MSTDIKNFVLSYAKEKYSTEPDFPFEDLHETMVLRRKDNKKWYGLIMNVSLTKFGFTEDRKIPVINLKCDPLMSGSLRLQDGIYPAYHMNKNSWISVFLDGSVDIEQIEFLIDMSYSLTAPKKKSKAKGAVTKRAEQKAK